MSITTLVTFIRLTDSQGDLKDLYQNGKRDDTSTTLTNESRNIDTINYIKNTKNFITYQSVEATTAEKFYYLPFLYQGAAKNRTGDNLEAGLIFANNVLAMNKARQAVKEKWHVEVSVCIVNPTTLEVERTLTNDSWLAASMSYDFETVEVMLSSAIDAVGSNAPTSVLTTSMVGALPTSAQIQNI
tara:strand:+ start:3461 stop:4018 length:558 start_codon:yes stop_codon:yes gene_type:complete